MRNHHVCHLRRGNQTCWSGKTQSDPDVLRQRHPKATSSLSAHTGASGGTVQWTAQHRSKSLSPLPPLLSDRKPKPTFSSKERVGDGDRQDRTRTIAPHWAADQPPRIVEADDRSRSHNHQHRRHEKHREAPPPKRKRNLAASARRQVLSRTYVVHRSTRPMPQLWQETIRLPDNRESDETWLPGSFDAASLVVSLLANNSRSRCGRPATLQRPCEAHCPFGKAGLSTISLITTQNDTEWTPSTEAKNIHSPPQWQLERFPEGDRSRCSETSSWLLVDWQPPAEAKELPLRSSKRTLAPSLTPKSQSQHQCRRAMTNNPWADCQSRPKPKRAHNQEPAGWFRMTATPEGEPATLHHGNSDPQHTEHPYRSRRTRQQRLGALQKASASPIMGLRSPL